MEPDTNEVKGLLKEVFGIGLFGRMVSQKMKFHDSDKISLFNSFSQDPVIVMLPAYKRIHVTKKRYEQRVQRFVELYEEKFNERLSINRGYHHQYFSESGWIVPAEDFA